MPVIDIWVWSLVGLGIVACVQKEVNLLSSRKKERVKEELQKHQEQMKILKMQKEREILEGRNRCKNVRIEELMD